MFRFKQFAIRQEHSAMKVGTDGVLVGSWATVLPGDRRILDIGTGTGLIALMLAQRAPEASVTGIDIADLTDALANGAASPWGDRLHFVRCPVQRFDAPRFDLIVSNPPYFVDSLTSPDAARTAVRHTVHLTFGELCDSVVRLLAPGGRFAVILPVSESALLLDLCSPRLQLTRRTVVRTTPRRAPKRVLLEFALPPAPTASGECAGEESDGTPAPSVSTEELVIGTGLHEDYTPEYRALTGDFYLKF